MSTAMNIYQRHIPPCPKKGRAVRCRMCNYYADLRPEGLSIVSLETTNQSKAHERAAFILKTRTGELKAFKNAIASWKNRLHINNVSQATQDHYLRLIEDQLLPWAEARGCLTVDRLTKQVIEEFRETKRNQKTDQPLSPRTVTKELADLKVFFKYLKRQKWIDVDPVAEIEPPIVSANEIVPYSHNEIIRIIAACESSPNPILARALVLTLRWTGLRISDVVGLRRDNINGARLNLFTKKNHMHVRQKVHQEALNALALLCVDDEWPFYFIPKGWSFEAAYADCRHLLDEVYKASGVPGAKNHRFRHTFISVGLAAGIGERAMADMVGITESVLRKYYSKWMAERDERVDEASDRIFAFEARRAEPPVIIEQMTPISKEVQ